MNVVSMEDTIKSLSQKYGNKHCAVACDISNAEEVDQLFEKVNTWKKEISILVNAAGVNSPPALVDEIEEPDFDRIIAVNLKGTMRIYQEEDLSEH